MATKTTEDRVIDDKIRQLNAALDSAQDIVLFWTARKNNYKGATEAAGFEKLINIVSKHLNQIASERKGIR